MAEYFNSFLNYVNNEKNLYRIYIFLVVFLCAVKLPALFSTDIQPWDEGMYASRVLSIYENGDILDQSAHSVGGFYSGSHPPLLIWIGYAFTLVFGTSAWVFKIIPFLFGLGCILLIMKLGQKLFDLKTGFFAALIFSSNLIFNIFAKRFQFDIPYTFLILLSFYFIALYINNPLKKYIALAGIAFGLCLMMKILVGFYIPAVLTGLYLLKRKTVPVKFSDLVMLTSIGVIIALPWHLYMMLTYGQEFFHYFLGFHILDRAFIGVEQNTKGSGPLYHINYFLSIIPFSIIVFFSFIKDARNFKSLDWQKIFLWIWFITGLLIITAFRTKLEVYVLLILVPGCFLIPRYLFELKKGYTLEKFLLLCSIGLNILWMASFYYRPAIKDYASSNKILVLLILLVILILIAGLAFFMSKKTNVSYVLLRLIALFFAGANIFFLVKPPDWEVEYDLTSIKADMDTSGRKKILYIGTDYRHNPQFTFYFNGIDIGWKNKEYSYEFIDTKSGLEAVKNKLNSLGEGEYNILVEEDNINRSNYPPSGEFIPGGINLIKKTGGYELYQN